ncbi:MAG: MAPEG family protein [Myxococcales bacterium]
MSTVLTCLLIGALLPILLSWVGAYFKFQKFGNIDNKNPRFQSAELEGAGARAVAAQQNAWEALAVFTAGVVAYGLQGTGSEIASVLAIVWVISRVLHGILYLANLDSLRTLAFLVGIGCSIALFFV